MAENVYTVEIVTEEVSEEPTRQILEGAVFYVKEVYQYIYSFKFETKEAALHLVEENLNFGGRFIEISRVYDEKRINANCEAISYAENVDGGFFISRENYCGYIVTKNGTAIEEYRVSNCREEQGEESWEYLHDEFGYAE